MAPLRYAAKFDPFLSLDCAPPPSTLAQSKERKGSNLPSGNLGNSAVDVIFNPNGDSAVDSGVGGSNVNHLIHQSGHGRQKNNR